MELQEKKGGIPSKQVIFQKAAGYAFEAIEVLVEAMRHGDNSNAKVGAAKTLLGKSLPDLKSAELLGKDGETLTFIIKRKDD